MYFHFHCDDQGYDLLAGLSVERFALTLLVDLGWQRVRRCVFAQSRFSSCPKGALAMPVRGAIQITGYGGARPGNVP